MRYWRPARLLKLSLAGKGVLSTRSISATIPRAQQQSAYKSQHTNFYRSHGRALFKSLTLAFLSYQIFYWTWITLETETMKDEKDREIKSLQEEVRMLANGQGSHVMKESAREGTEKRLLDEEG